MLSSWFLHSGVWGRTALRSPNQHMQGSLINHEGSTAALRLFSSVGRASQARLRATRNSFHTLHVVHDARKEASRTNRVDSNLALLFAGLPTCQISDALIKLKVPHGGHIPDIIPVSLPSPDARVCGPAYTVRVVTESDNDSDMFSSQIHWMESVPAGSIVVISAPPETKSGVWGSLMSAGAQAHGLEGVVISGRCRDVAGHRSLNFPVFARGTSTLGPTSFTRTSQVNVPLVIEPQSGVHQGTNFPPVTVEPGNWIIADGEGVVCVPRGLEREAIELAMDGIRIDEVCNAAIRTEKRFQKAFEIFSAKF